MTVSNFMSDEKGMHLTEISPVLPVGSNLRLPPLLDAEAPLPPHPAKA